MPSESDEAKLGQLQSIAKARGGVLLSSAYRGVMVNLKWKCEAGHTWLALPLHVKRGSWCGRCYHDTRRKEQLSDMGLDELKAAVTMFGSQRALARAAGYSLGMVNRSMKGHAPVTKNGAAKIRRAVAVKAAN